MSGMAADATPERPGRPRATEADATRRNILAIATEEFAAKGYSGARIDEIAARTDTSKRMIYYYFTDKAGLFVAVLEAAYRRIRSIEAALDLDHLPPLDALRRLVGFTFDYQNANPDFIRLVMVENIHDGAHLARSREAPNINAQAIDAVHALYRRGVAAGVFRSGLDPIDIHMSISALSFFNVSNRATFSRIFAHDMASDDALARRRAVVIDTIERFMAA